MRALRYFDEIIDYGGEPFTRAEAILHMQSMGIDRPCIDRWFQGYELGQRIRERNTTVITRIFLTGETKRPRKLCR